METTTELPLILLLILCFVMREFISNTNAYSTNCLDSDREALINFKNGLHDPANRLSSWKGSNCCQWKGISCDNGTGSVIAVDLHNPNPRGFNSSSRYVSYDLSGEVKPSLTKLKSLRHLDLSFNKFNDNPIPEFFGLLEDLQYLNLSHAGFGGSVPPNIGNLSSLQCLDLEENWLLEVGSLEWVTGLVSLKHLVVNGIDLSNIGSEWTRQLNKLPFLTELHLSGCSLSGSIPPLTFLNTTTLVVLDISFNDFNSKILDSLVNVSSLVTLDISHSISLFGRIPLGFSELPNLRFLYLDHNNHLTASCHQFLEGKWEKIQVLDLSHVSLHGELPASIGNLTFLTHIVLNENYVEGGIPSSIGNLCGLISLEMSHNNMNGTLPESLGGIENCLSSGPLPSLQSLDLSNNQLVGNLPEWLGHLENLVILDLSSNSLHGKLPTIGNLTFLSHLNLFSNSLEGGIPSSIGNLCNLMILDVSSNNMNGTLPQFLEGTENCLSRRPLPKLQNLLLSNNYLVGNLPEWLGHLENLVVLDLSNNSLHGPIPTSLGSLQILSVLVLARNELNGSLPESVGKYSELYTFDVSSNHLTGVLTENHFSRQTKLTTLSLSSNSFTLNVSSNWVPPFQVQHLHMGSCHLGPSFPAWVKSQEVLESLDLSNASISGSVPYWFWDFSFSLLRLNLSFNHLVGQLPSPLQFYSGLPEYSHAVVDFSSNNFSGSIPILSGNIGVLNLSKNKLSGCIPSNLSHNLVFLSVAYNQINGEIPDSIGDLNLQVVDLSNNFITGRIPSSIGNCSYLYVLDIGNNHLFGTIPASLGRLSELGTLHLNDNKLYGQIPSSFQNLTSLETLNLGNNRLTGRIPTWIGKGIFESLRILSLRSNSFSGQLPALLSNLSSLQVLDLAENQLVGGIPTSFGYFEAMSQDQIINRYLLYKAISTSRNNAPDNVGSYYESFDVNMKGQLLRYTRTLSLVTMLDLSGNNLGGDLPTEITNLSGLLVLNLSRNHLTGPIPKGISKLKQLSSLDLSCNKFSGAIPQSLGVLSFLGYLNLSNNDFSGVIPYKDHMTTFDAPSFAGNPRLCGGPLAIKCQVDENGDKTKKRSMTTSDGDNFIDKWLYLSIGLGFAAGILVPYLIIAMRKSWSVAYFDAVDTVEDRILFLWLKHTTMKQRTRRHQQRR